MSLSARARTLTDKELLSLFEVTPEEGRKELAHELYVRLLRAAFGPAAKPQTQLQ